MSSAVLLVAHGTVDSLDELPEFLANIRRGHPPPPELLAEVRRRYEAIGGVSPLNAINRSLAAKLEAKLGVPVRMGNRLAKPYARDVLAEIADATRVAVIPLAQHSAYVYADYVKSFAAEIAPRAELVYAPNWGQAPALLDAFARRVRDALASLPAARRDRTTVVTSAHSLPLSVIRGGDAYEDEVRASAAAVASRLDGVRTLVAFQSQGMSAGPGGRPVEWLGPDLPATLDAIAGLGDTHVVVAPIGFLADHVEILYDLDIEATAWAMERGLTLSRTESLNDEDDFVDVLAGVARPLLALS
jgi:ferrochelatase